MVATRERWSKRIATATLNRWLAAATAAHPPPMAKGRRVKIRYIAQVSTRPPTFVLFVSQAGALPDSYLRYLTNSLREAFELPGVPLRLRLRTGDEIRTCDPPRGRSPSGAQIVRPRARPRGGATGDPRRPLAMRRGNVLDRHRAAHRRLHFGAAHADVGEARSLRTTKPWAAHCSARHPCNTPENGLGVGPEPPFACHVKGQFRAMGRSPATIPKPYHWRETACAHALLARQERHPLRSRPRSCNRSAAGCHRESDEHRYLRIRPPGLRADSPSRET